MGSRPDDTPSWSPRFYVRFVTVLVLACLSSIAAAPAVAQGNGAQDTVAAFYRWYISHHGRVERSWGGYREHYGPNESPADSSPTVARELFDPDLYDEIAQTFFKDDFKSNDILVSTCPGAMQCKQVAYDFFANARTPASSFAIEATYSNGSEATVDLVLRFAEKSAGESHVTAIVHRSGNKWLIANLRFEKRGFYYGTPIVDLRAFLQAYNC